MSEKYEVSLVVKSSDSSALKLRILREQRSKKSAYFNTDFGVEVVQNKLRNMFSSNCMMLDIFLELKTGDLKYTEHSFKMSYQQLISPVIIPNDHNMSVIQGLCILIDIIEFHGCPRIIVDVVEDHHQFFQIAIDLFRRLDRSCQQNFYWSLLVEVFLELVQFCFIILI